MLNITTDGHKGIRIVSDFYYFHIREGWLESDIIGQQLYENDYFFV